MSQQHYNSFTEFWPHYVAEHSKPATRLLHLIGTVIALALVVYLILIGKWWLFPMALIPGYGAAWIGHFFIEKNLAVGNGRSRSAGRKKENTDCRWPESAFHTI